MRNNKLSKQVLLILLMIIGGSLKAQNDSTYIYQSFFGNDSTRINIYDLHICDGAETYIVQMSKNDTVNINGNLYYKGNEVNDNDHYYYREDIETGRLYQYIEEFDIDVLICDMSLNVGDTFHFPDKPNSGWELITGVVADVRYENGKKIIEFDDEVLWHFEISPNHPLTFIEGNFPKLVPTAYLSGYNELLCQFKDGEQTYHNPDYDECYYLFAFVEEFESSNITIKPTVFSNSETISIKADSEIKEVKMIDMLGRKVKVSVNQTSHTSCQININQKCNSGIYLIIVETKNEIYFEKVVLRD